MGINFGNRFPANNTTPSLNRHESSPQEPEQINYPHSEARATGRKVLSVLSGQEQTSSESVSYSVNDRLRSQMQQFEAMQKKLDAANAAVDKTLDRMNTSTGRAGTQSSRNGFGIFRKHG